MVLMSSEMLTAASVQTPSKGGQALQLLLPTSPFLSGAFRKDTLSGTKIQEPCVPSGMLVYTAEAVVDEEKAKPHGRPHTLHR